jgi:hypothetical protein
MEEVHTYKDLSRHYKKSVDTMRRWFSNMKGVLRHSDQSALVPESVRLKRDQQAACRKKRSGPSPKKKPGKKQ